MSYILGTVGASLHCTCHNGIEGDNVSSTILILDLKVFSRYGKSMSKGFQPTLKNRLCHKMNSRALSRKPSQRVINPTIFILLWGSSCTTNTVIFFGPPRSSHVTSIYFLFFKNNNQRHHDTKALNINGFMEFRTFG